MIPKKRRRYNDSEIETHVLVAYDVEVNKVRNRVFEACKDYGLRSFQYSTFMGMLSRVKIRELRARLEKEIGKTAGTYIIVPVCRSDRKKILWKGEPLSLYQSSLAVFV